jgi:hypothetical protein
VNHRTVYNGRLEGRGTLRRSKNLVRAMAGRPSIVTDYVSIILRAIENTQNDPVRLRTLVYDVARLSLGKHVLTNYQQLGSAGLQQHISDLETAIHHVEGIAQRQLADFSKQVAAQEKIADITKKVQEQIADLSRKAQEEIADVSKNAQEQIADSSKQEPAQESTDLSKKVASHEQKDSGGDLVIRLLEDKDSASDHKALTVRDSFEETIFDETRPDKTALVVQPQPTAVYTGRAEILQPLDYRVPAFGSGPKRKPVDAAFGLQLVMASVIGIGIYVASLIGFDHAGRPSTTPGQVEAVASAPTPAATAPVKAVGVGAQSLGFPLPTVYGVYAASEGKLFELDPLPLKVPDARVAISAMITSPSHVALPEGKVQFILFRRDLVSSAPTEVFVRVIARVAREMKFNAGGRPTTINVDGEWAVRSKQYVFRVAPLGDSPEMVVLRPADSEQALTPGRYALVLAGKGYDFTIEGQVTDAAQCLERSNVVGGIVYSECSASSPRLTN